MRRSLLVMAAAGLLAAALPAASGAPAHASKVATVVIDKLAFGDSPAGLHAGDTVEWVNRDIFQHSVTGKGFDLDLKPGGRGRLVLSGSGVITYVCRYHPGMKGQIIVEK